MRLLTATAAALLAAGAAQAQTEIGVTMTAFDNPFLTVLLNGMRGEAERTEGVELLEEDANLDVGRQLNQVQNFIATGVDAIIVNPVDGDSTIAITQMAQQAGIPLVYVNHPPVDVGELPENAAFVGSNEIDSGTMQTEEVCKLMDGTGRAVVMMGPLENHSALVRTKDVHDVLARPECDGIEIVEEQTANWSRTEAQDLMRSWLTAGVAFDAVIANNDEMAIGAINAMRNSGVAMDEVIVAGIDATADALAAIEAGDMDVTVFQDAEGQGTGAVEAIQGLIEGEAVEQKIFVPYQLVTPENVSEFQNAG